MDTSNTDSTLNIRPIVPGGAEDWANKTRPDNNQEAASQARLKIEQISRPTYQGSVPAKLPSGTADLPKPVSPAQQNLRKLPRTTQIPHFSKVKPLLSALASFLFILMLFKAPVLLSQIKYLGASGSANSNQIALPNNSAIAETVPPNPLITIPKINVSAPIVFPAGTTNAPNYDPELENGVVHYPNTALPGQAGNSVIFGHSSNDWWQPGNYKFVFVLLDKIVPGDTFSVNYNSKRYIYQVTNTKIVEATDLSVLAPTADPTITLISCWPAGTSLKREIVQGKQISPTPQTGTAPVQTQTPARGTLLPSNAPGFWEQIQQFWQGVKDSVSNKPANVSAPIQNQPN